MNRRHFIISSGLFLGTGFAGGEYWRNRWKYIVVHHSAGSRGDIPLLRRVHRERQAGDPIDAIPYHYVIGNGNGLGLGEIATDWRAEYHLWGAHVSGRNFDRNLRGLGICLIGNFEVESVPKEQYRSLVRLTRQLMEAYEISPGNVCGHGQVPGETTKCPGKNFPHSAFQEDIRKVSGSAIR